MFNKTKPKFWLIFGTVILLAGIASVCAAAEADGPVSDPVSGYLHANHLPLVEARTIVTASGERSELLYGYVASDWGKLDAEEQTCTPRFGFAHHDRLSDETSPSREYVRLQNMLGVEMAEKNVLTVRVSAELQDRLDAIADAIDRPRSWVVNRALERFVESEAWQIEEIKRGLAEADAGDFASEAEVGAIFEKWRRVNPDAD